MAVYLSMSKIAKRCFDARQKSRLDAKDVTPRISFYRISAAWRKEGFDRDGEMKSHDQESELTNFSPLAYAVAKVIIACLSCLTVLGVSKIDLLLDRVLCDMEKEDSRK